MKTYKVITQAFVVIDVEAENEDSAIQIALDTPAFNWEVSSLSEEYNPMVFEEDGDE